MNKLKLIKSFLLVMTIITYLCVFPGCQAYPPRIDTEPPKIEPLTEPGKDSAITIAIPYSNNGNVGKGTGVKSRWYIFKLDEESNLKIFLKIHQYSQDIDMKLYDRYERELERGATTQFTEQIIKELSEGVYFIQVYVYNDKNGSSYTLEVNSNPLPGSSLEVKSSALEGSSKNHPIEIEPYRQMYGEIGIKNDTWFKWYKVNIPAESGISIDLSILKPNRDIDMRLYDEFGNEWGASTGDGQSEQISKVVPPGTYFFRIYLDTNSLGSEYRLKVTIDPIKVELEKEIAETPENETPVSIDAPIVPNDIDIETVIIKDIGVENNRIHLYKINIEESGRYKIHFVPSNGDDLKLELKKNDEVVPITFEHGNKIVPLKLDRGKYMIRVYSERDIEPTTYSLSIKKDPGTAFYPNDEEKKE